MPPQPPPPRTANVGGEGLGARLRLPKGVSNSELSKASNSFYDRALAVAVRPRSPSEAEKAGSAKENLARARTMSLAKLESTRPKANELLFRNFVDPVRRFGLNTFESGRYLNSFTYVER